jgi:hypothetical protein
MAKDKHLSRTAKRLITVETLFKILFIFLIILISFISKNIYETKTQEYKNERFTYVNDNILQRFDVLLKEKMNTSLLVASSLSKNINIKKALALNNANALDMDLLLDEMRTNREYVNIQAEVIDADGVSFKRSWTHLSGDDLVKDDPQMAHLIKYPRVVTDIVANKYGLTISNKIPIYFKDRFLGLFGVNIHFDTLVDIFAKEGFRSVILLNKLDSKNIFQELSFSKKFIGDCYIVNSNAEKYLLKIIKNNLDEFCNDKWETPFKVNESTDHLISRYTIKNEAGNEIAQVMIFKSIDEIDFQDLGFFQTTHIAGTVFLILLVAFFVNYFSILSRIKKLLLENEELIKVNAELKTKTDELDFNDKKLDNLFNMQPNLMFMHNGKEVTKANQRFMGFFNRFGTFEGFKKKHKCVSELFEKYEAPNYIWDQYIQGEFWIDYMLNNPRRLYKTVMSINGDPHHFIIKFNEMNYSKHVTERIIIVALVDMTQDLVNYKTLEESSKILKDININEKLELKEEKENTDISYELKSQIEQSIKELSGKDVVQTDIVKVEAAKIPQKDNIIVKGDLKFSDVESAWQVFVPAGTSSRLLNMMSGNERAPISLSVSKDEIDTAREFVLYFTTSFCDLINSKDFHDLKDGKYSESTSYEIMHKELKSLEDLYRVSVKLKNSSTLLFYIKFDKDIIPFFKQIINNEPLRAFEQKTQSPEKDQIKKVQPVEEDVTENSKENNPAKPEKNKPKLKVKSASSNNNKVDAYSLIQNGLTSIIKEITSKGATSGKIKPVKELGNDIVYMDNKFKIGNGNKSIDWSLAVPEKTLLKFGDDPKSVAQKIKNLLAPRVESLTGKKASLVCGEINTTKSGSKFKDYKVFDLNIVYEKENLAIYIALKEK